MKLQKTFSLLLPVLIIIGIVLRLWRLSELFHFTYDEEIIAFVGKRMFINGHIPLIGGVTPMHVHLAPYFYWVSGIWLWLSRLNPVGWGVGAALIAAVTMLFLYHVGQTLFNNRVGYIATFLYAFSFYQNLFDRHYWGLVFDGILTLLVFLSLYKLRAGKYRFAYVLAGALAFGFHTDPSTLALFVFTVLAWVIFKIRLPGSVLVKASLIFLLSFLPLVVFDARHDFSNSRGIFQYFTETGQGKKGVIVNSAWETLLFLPRTLSRTLFVYGDTDLAKQYSYCPSYATGRLESVPFAASAGVLGIIGLMIIFLRRSTNSAERSGLQLILLLLTSVYGGVSIYGIVLKGDLFDHYLATLFPIFFLSVAYVLARTTNGYRYVMFGLLGIFVVLNLGELVTAKHRFGYADKVNAVRWAIATTGKEPFSLDVIGDCFRYNGYRYLFYLFGKQPVKSYVDANFTYLYDAPPAQVHPRYLVVITNPDQQESSAYWKEYAGYKEKLITSSQFGTMEVLIVDNSKLDFVGKF